MVRRSITLAVVLVVIGSAWSVPVTYGTPPSASRPVPADVLAGAQTTQVPIKSDASADRKKMMERLVLYWLLVAQGNKAVR